MLFRRKGRLRREYDERLLEELEFARASWERQRDFVNRSFEVNEGLIEGAQVAESLYFSLLGEAKKRKVRMR